MTTTAQTKVSVLVPAFNEEDNVEAAYRAIVTTFDHMPECELELIFTDNHSTDRTFPLLKALAAADPRVRVIRFSRNVGFERSLLAGFKAATGDCAVQIDCDLQDPPSLIPKMLELWHQGHQVVYGIRRKLPDSLPMAMARRLFYRLLDALSEDDLPPNAGEFRLVDRRILDELRLVDDTSPYLRGLISAMGFSQIGFEYDRESRTAGASKFRLKALVLLSVDAFLNHSLVPLRLASLTALLVASVTSLLILFYLVGYFVFGSNWPQGFATTTILLLLSVSLNAMFLGIIGEYVGRIYMQAKGRPRVIVEATAGPDSIKATGGRRLYAA
ncbi:glycosyltransferase family 2 protein [Jiella sp. MQZ9-1]|uniref:Glycosyltransferase family 2 protein n=1 Tax=Jiella flava TaxID=2816857 RepID=A0A939JX57_9HYPH|nr:glycosyltransferase family 2 protein [Jiella flava]MBO0663021.1 glycosyltransferase family 2 protein [Jiella flava]MCD2471440.1 glycosyltransferase family 2 protein [Jiella flava]